MFKTTNTVYELEPIEGHGLWDGKQVFGDLPKQSDYEGKIAVLTRATIKLSGLNRFWAHVDAIAEQARELPYYHIFAGASHPKAILLAEKLIALTGGRMKRVFFGLSGSDANETQIKLVWYYHNVIGKPHKKKIIARQHGYHGATTMTASLTGLPNYHSGFDLPFALVKHTMAPDAFWAPETDPRAFSQRCADELERLILEEGPDTVGAFIAEPVVGSGGILPPPPGYWEAIQPVLRKYDILLIADEVITAFETQPREDLPGMDDAFASLRGFV